MRILRGTESCNNEPIDKPYLTKGELIRLLQEDCGTDDTPVSLRTWGGEWELHNCIKVLGVTVGSQHRVLLQGEVV